MKKALAMIAAAALLAACSNESSTSAPAPAPAPAPASSAPAPAPVPAPSAPASAAPASGAVAELPAECQAYLDKVAACVGKQSGAAADAIKASAEQTRASWASLGADPAQLVSACKAASDAFTAQAAAMNC